MIGSTVTVAGTQTSVISADIRVGSNADRTFNVGETGQDVDLLVSGKLGHCEGHTWGFATKTGPGTMVLSNPNNSIGRLTVNQGKVVLQDTMAGFGNGGLITNATIEANVSTGNSLSYAQGLGGSGTFVKSGADMTRTPSPAMPRRPSTAGCSC